jgi:hypothetical protein
MMAHLNTYQNGTSNQIGQKYLLGQDGQWVLVKWNIWSS